MRILHITERYGKASIGGAQLSVASLAHAQAAVGDHHVGVLFIGDGNVEIDDKSNDIEQIPIRESWSCRQLRKSRSNRLVNAATYLYEGNVRGCSPDVTTAIEQFKPDIINTHIVFGINEDVWRVAHQRGIPIIHTIRDYFLLCARSTFFRSGKSCNQPCIECRMITARRRWSVRHLSGLVSISESLLTSHLKLMDFPCPTVLIGNSISPASFSISRPSPGHEPPRPFKFGFIGRLVPAKGIEALIDAFKYAAIDNTELLIAGDGSLDYVESLRTILPSAGVQLVGRVDAQSFYGAIDAVVVPSLWDEPFGRVVAEAMLSGVPLICSNRGAFPELLVRYKCGLLINPDDIQDFAAALVKMHSDYPTYLRQSASVQPCAAEDFSETRIAIRYLKFYSEVAAERT